MARYQLCPRHPIPPMSMSSIPELTQFFCRFASQTGKALIVEDSLHTKDLVDVLVKGGMLDSNITVNTNFHKLKSKFDIIWIDYANGSNGNAKNIWSDYLWVADRLSPNGICVVHMETDNRHELWDPVPPGLNIAIKYKFRTTRGIALVKHSGNLQQLFRQDVVEPYNKQKKVIDLSTGYIGVYKKKKRFEARMELNTGWHTIGTFGTSVEAALAYNKCVAGMTNKGRPFLLNTIANTSVAEVVKTTKRKRGRDMYTADFGAARKWGNKKSKNKKSKDKKSWLV